VIKDVEEVTPCLKRKSFCESELSPQRKIKLRGAESAQRISPQVALT